MKKLELVLLFAALLIAPSFAGVRSATLAAPAVAAIAPSPCPTQVLGDHDGDGDCDDDDLDIFTACWLKGDPKTDWNFDCDVDFQDVYRFFDFYGGSSTWLDFNGDGAVNISDLGAFVSQWQDEFQGVVNTSHTNITRLTAGDCVVNFQDLNVFLIAFNNCPWG